MDTDATGSRNAVQRGRFFEILKALINYCAQTKMKSLGRRYITDPKAKIRIAMACLLADSTACHAFSRDDTVAKKRAAKHRHSRE